MFWLRQQQRLGRYSIVGTTVRTPEALPEHLAADEHHTHWRGEKGYIATTAAKGCLLGVALTDQASDKSLTAAYGVFQKEAISLDPSYQPETVNTDGWLSTQNAFAALFPGIVTILCFLHGFLKVRDRGRGEHELHERIWEIYRMTRLMYSGRGLHGNHTASERRLRGWALMVNFVPYAHRSNVQRAHRCPAHQLSNKCYSENWLENLLVSASMNGKSWV